MILIRLKFFVIPLVIFGSGCVGSTTNSVIRNFSEKKVESEIGSKGEMVKIQRIKLLVKPDIEYHVQKNERDIHLQKKNEMVATTSNQEFTIYETLYPTEKVPLIFLEKNKRNETIKFRISKNFPNPANNTIITKNGKKYRLVKVKKDLRKPKGASVLESVPKMLLSFLPTWMKKDNETDTVKKENQTFWTQQQSDDSEIVTTIAPRLKGSGRLKRLLNLFTIVKFENVECYANDNKGICLSQWECEEKGGKFTTTCAENFGVCCYNEKTCGEHSQETCTYFVNKGFPKPSHDAPSVCSLTLEKTNSKVKQIRLDFISFQLRNPLNGTCFHDRLVLTGQDVNKIVPDICGINSGQHLYLDVDDSEGPYKLNIITLGEHFPRIFRIKVTQLDAEDALFSPKHCLQYFTEETGIIQSFNYRNEFFENPSEVTTGYFNNLNYVICIKKAKSYCSISYENEETNNTTEPTFQILNTNQDLEKMLPPMQAGVESFNCPNDYISVSGTRLCGEKLNDGATEMNLKKNFPVTDTSGGPFLVQVRTDGSVIGRGFKLKYLQKSCYN